MSHNTKLPSTLPSATGSLRGPLFAALAATLALSGGTAARAQLISGSQLVTTANQTTLETWLGQGPLSLANLFSHNYGGAATAADFHAAADGKGATFTFASITITNGSNANTTYTIGGYNPQSWNSSDTMNLTPNQADRTAFLFNLSTGARINQKTDALGINQTANYANFGPAFGQGYDLFIDYDLDAGYSFQHSYGPNGEFGNATLLGQPHPFLNPEFIVNRLEVFSVTPDGSTGAVPEPGAVATGAAMFGTAALGIVRGRARRRRSSAA